MNFIFLHNVIFHAYVYYLSIRLLFLFEVLQTCEMMIRESVGVFNYQPGESQGILIHVLGMTPVEKC